MLGPVRPVRAILLLLLGAVGLAAWLLVTATPPAHRSFSGSAHEGGNTGAPELAGSAQGNSALVPAHRRALSRDTSKTADSLLPTSTTLTVRVKWPEGVSPTGLARVTCYFQGQDPGPSGVTDAEGKVVFPRLPDLLGTPLVLQAWADPHWGASHRSGMSLPEYLPFLFSGVVALTLRPLARARGRVFDPASDTPIAGARLAYCEGLYPFERGTFQGPTSAPTGSDGRYEAWTPLPEEGARTLDAYLVAWADGREAVVVTLPRTLEAGAEWSHDMPLRPGGSITGRVLSPDGQALRGARVKVAPEGRAPPRWLNELDPRSPSAGDPGVPGDIQSTTSGADGSYHIWGLPVGERFALWAYDDAFPPSPRRMGIEVHGTGEPTPVDLVFENWPTLRVSVRNTQGRMLPNATVWVDSEAHNPPEGETLVLTALRPGPRAITATCDGYAPAQARVELRAGGVQDLVLTLGHGHAMNCRVVDERGRGLAGVTVLLSRTDLWHYVSEQSDEDGRARFRQLAPGRYDVEVIAGSRESSANVDQVLQPPKYIDVPGPDATLVVRDMATVRLRLRTDPETSLPETCSVWLTSDSHSRWVRLNSASGEAQFDAPLGRYTLSGHAEGFAPFQRPVDVGPAGAFVDVEFSVGHPLKGMVVDDAGRGIADARIRLEGQAWRETYTNEAGSFTLAHVPAGQVALFVHARNRPDQRYVVQGGPEAASVRLVARSGTRVAGRVLGPEEKLLDDCFGYVDFTPHNPDESGTQSAHIDRVGKFSLVLLPGKYTAHWHLELQSDREPREVQTELDIPNQPTFALEWSPP